MLKENFKKYFENLKKSDNNLEPHLLAMLHEIQKENGHICEEDIEELSGLTQLPYSRIKAVLTFYTMYNLKKTG
ncbi:MAG: NAD(P)H-dependent oxidoreductase subunit E, partial [Elusimicrobia bacterium]|nr:NAD(P)H-dependent oxidoreductase subunit E [Elusimicrobiota bacterium]